MDRTFLITTIASLCLWACSPDTTTDRAGQGAVERVAPEQIRVNGAADRTSSSGTTTTPGINPPHGEPGHVCSIPVGEPLNGATDGTNTASSTIAPHDFGNGTAGTSIKVDPSTSASNGQKGMINPAHGEPGHVCGVPVGEPLP